MVHMLLCLVTQAAGACDSGFSDSMNSKCYRHLSGVFSYQQCTAQCSALAATMPCVEDKAESDHLHDVLPVRTECCGFQDQSCCLWLGLTQSVTSVTNQGWDTWDSSSCQSELRLWNPGEPNDYDGGDENCAVMGFFGTRTCMPAQLACIRSWTSSDV